MIYRMILILSILFEKTLSYLCDKNLELGPRNGLIKDYFEDGSIKEEVNFVDGELGKEVGKFGMQMGRYQSRVSRK